MYLIDKHEINSNNMTLLHGTLCVFHRPHYPASPIISAIISNIYIKDYVFKRELKYQYSKEVLLWKDKTLQQQH